MRNETMSFPLSLSVKPTQRQFGLRELTTGVLLPALLCVILANFNSLSAEEPTLVRQLEQPRELKQPTPVDSANQVKKANSALKSDQQRNSTLVDNQVRPVSNETGTVANEKLAQMLKQLEKCQEEVDKLQDYTADFEKYELVDGNRQVHQRMKLKHRTNPFSVHLHFLSGSPQAEQVLYQQGWNQNQIMIKLQGALSLLTSNVSLAPRDPKAMENSRHPITEIGLKGLLNGVVNMWKDDLKYGDMEVLFYKDAKLNSKSTKTYFAFKTVHPQPRNVPRFQETTLWVDKQTLLPVKLVNRAFNPNGGKPILVEMYQYTNLKANVGLQNADFDPRRYQF